MKKQTILKIVLSIVFFIVILCLEIFGLQFLKNEEILFCSSSQSIPIKKELSNITGALPNTGSYSVKVITRDDDGIRIYYMYDGKISEYETTEQELYYGTGVINTALSKDAVKGEVFYYGIIIGTAILIGILIIYLFVSKNSLKGFIKLGYFVLSLLVLTFLLCVVPMLSKNHGGAIYYYTVILGTYLIGFVYGYKNRVFFLPTIVMVPLWLVAIWFNYRHALLALENIGAYLFLNFIGALTSRILEKNKGMKRKHFIFYAIITMLLLIGSYANKIVPRTATSMISDCCNMALHGIAFSVLAYMVYLFIKKIQENRKNACENTINKDVTVASESDNEIANEKDLGKIDNNKRNLLDTQKTIDEVKSKKEKKKSVIEFIVVIILIIASTVAIWVILKPKNYIETNLQSYSETLAEQYGYRILQQKVYVTCDFGKDWSEIPATFTNVYPSNREFLSESYYMDNNKLIFEYSNGEHFIGLIYSDDNGATWQETAITDTSGYIIYMKFFDKENGIAMVCYGNELGQREYIRATITHDGGKTWITQKGENASVRINRGAEIEFTSMQDGTIENISYDGSKTVYVTQDSGITWNEE